MYVKEGVTTIIFGEFHPRSNCINIYCCKILGKINNVENQQWKYIFIGAIWKLIKELSVETAQDYSYSDSHSLSCQTNWSGCQKRFRKNCNLKENTSFVQRILLCFDLQRILFLSCLISFHINGRYHEKLNAEISSIFYICIYLM